MRRLPPLLIGIMIAGSTTCAAESSGRAGTRRFEDDRRLQAVVAHADHALERGRDRWSGKDTPLLSDGIDPVSGEPAVWRFNGDAFIIHNLANQQNLFRVLHGLTRLTGDDRYGRAARDAVRYHFDHLRSPCGKLRWGGHQFIDLRTLEPVGHFDANCHEFKRNFPFYELMWDVDREATAQFLRALWEGHILDWPTLSLNRHAPYGAGPPPTADVWERPFARPEPFFECDGLSFLNCGADLIYGGAMLYRLSGERPAFVWAGRLADMYTRARHPETGMGAYQFSRPRRRQAPPPEGPLTGNLTWSHYGDRIENKFGRSGSSDPEDEFYNPVKDKVAADGMPVAREGWVWSASGGFPWYALVQLALAESIGEEAAAFARDAADHLEAHARHAYDPIANHFRPMWADGTDVTGLRIPRTGYGRGGRGDPYVPSPATADHLTAYARAYRLTQRAGLWETARAIACGLGLGEIGTEPGARAAFNTETPAPEPELIFALIELHLIAPSPGIVEAARATADRILETRFHYGLFMPSAEQRFANFNAREPLALLALEAVLRGEADLVPAYVGSRGYIHGDFDGHGRTYDSRAIWSRTRDEDR